MKPTTITWTCPHCERDTPVTVHPYVPAKTWGSPERCYPAESARIEPDECSNCEHPIDVGNALEQADEQEADAHAARANGLADRRRDERL